MPVSNELLEYQQLDGELRKIEQELASTEEWKKFSQAKKFIDSAQVRLESLDKHAMELRTLRDDLANRAEEMTKTIAEYADLDEILEESGGDISFYKKNAQSLLEKLRNVKGELNKLLSEVNSVSEEFKKLKEQTIAMQKQRKEYNEKFKKLRDARAEEVKNLSAKLDAVSKNIAPPILERYKQKRKERIFPIVVPLKGDFCICGFEFPKYHQSELAGGNVVECENCRRFVYKP